MFDKVFKDRHRGHECPSEESCIPRKHRRRQIPGFYSHDDLPVPIRINNYKQKNRKVIIKSTASRTEPYSENKTRKLLLLRKNKESFDNSEKGCGLSRWCAKKKALRELKNDHKKQEKRAADWQKWKYQEAERVRRADIEDQRRKQEAEYIRQLAEIEQEKRELIKKTSKTRHPFPTKKTPPREIFKKDLPKDPYYPKKIELSSDDYLVEKSRKQQKREAKQRKREAKRARKVERRAEKRLRKKKYVRERDPYPEVAQHSKCSKIRTCLNKLVIPRRLKKKQVKPYTGTYDTEPYKTDYQDYYDKPNTETLYTDPYQSYYDRSKSKKHKRKDGGKSKKGKRRKDPEPIIVGKRTERRKYSRMFVNCFYRTCCECYCWFSAFLLLGIAIVMVI